MNGIFFRTLLRQCYSQSVPCADPMYSCGVSDLNTNNCRPAPVAFIWDLAEQSAVTSTERRMSWRATPEYYYPKPPPKSYRDNCTAVDGMCSSGSICAWRAPIEPWRRTEILNIYWCSIDRSIGRPALGLIDVSLSMKPTEDWFRFGVVSGTVQFIESLMRWLIQKVNCEFKCGEWYRRRV